MAKQTRPKYLNLKFEMIKKSETIEDVAKLLGMSKSTFFNKLAGVTEWSIGEIETLCKHYDKDYYYLFHTDFSTKE